MAQTLARKLREGGGARPLYQRVILGIAHPFWTCAAIGAGVGLTIGYIACVRMGDAVEIVWYRLGY